MVLNNQQITEEIKNKIKICIETNENENKITQTLWDTVKAVPESENGEEKSWLKAQHSEN